MAVKKIAPLLVIIGETASGKSELALQLAQQFNGEIICADSRTVYKDMDISTAKPTADDRRAVAHHLLDIVRPNEKFTAADFQTLAKQAIKDISSREKLPIVVGGTGLYIDALIFDYSFQAPADPLNRASFAKKSVPELQHMLREKGIKLPANEQNRRHLTRALETGGLAASRKELRPDTLIIGLKVDRQTLKARVSARADFMLKAGLVEEIRQLADRYGWDSEAMQTPACKAFRGYIEGVETLEHAKQRFIKYDLDLAKRQRTWFKRNKSVQWFSTPVKWSNVVDVVTTFLNS